ncbi:hypothetical protein AMJ71_05480 [candidate division TA06 bacterium SM1_40]|uniref:GGDEF domain-containing protein n=1 Tax=candidate division TA06 bacterium SM1_40 TaxID=1703773 RepID=A0A0S8JJT7_UNCT6|nr:MAG: hypothetical protein AMJ71_05480 [candidate division TA06 bacterium SM1_40]
MDFEATPGLRSRRHLWKQLAVEIERAARYHRPLSVTVYDVDHLGAYNERHSREDGDKVLGEIATILIAQTRAADIPAYYGGGTFVLAVPEATKHQAFGLAERVRRMVEFTFAPGRRSRHKVAVTTSAGVSSYPADGEDPMELVRAARKAMKAAKKAGRNVVMSTPEVPEVAVPVAAKRAAGPKAAAKPKKVARPKKAAKRAKPKPAARARKKVAARRAVKRKLAKAKRVGTKRAAKPRKAAARRVKKKAVKRKPARAKKVTKTKKATRAKKATKSTKTRKTSVKRPAKGARSARTARRTGKTVTRRAGRSARGGKRS